mmetsp:Transcript_36469/g.117525  ORF Transcript_36469/g.117525 Transcript_36469/m.117525 type:complete len:357 (-) Transcript_36469:2341-3411(-)
MRPPMLDKLKLEFVPAAGKIERVQQVKKKRVEGRSHAAGSEHLLASSRALRVCIVLIFFLQGARGTPVAPPSAPPVLRAGKTSRGGNCCDKAAPLDQAELTSNKTQSNVIMVTHIDPRGQRSSFFRTTLAMLQTFAKTNQADVVQLTHRLPVPCQHNLHVNFDVVFAVRDLLSVYRRVMSVDDTYVFSPHAPNVFAQIPDGKIGGVSETGYTSSNLYMNTACKHYNVDAKKCLSRRPQLPLNGGFLILSQQHKVLLHDLEQPQTLAKLKPLKGGLWLNQPFWNSRIVQYDVGVHTMGKQWAMVGTVYAKATKNEKKHACAIHMTKYVESRLGGREKVARHLMESANNGSELQCRQF